MSGIYRVLEFFIDLKVVRVRSRGSTNHLWRGKTCFNVCYVTSVEFVGFVILRGNSVYPQIAGIVTETQAWALYDGIGWTSL